MSAYLSVPSVCDTWDFGVNRVGFVCARTYLSSTAHGLLFAPRRTDGHLRRMTRGRLLARPDVNSAWSDSVLIFSRCIKFDRVLTMSTMSKFCECRILWGNFADDSV